MTDPYGLIDRYLRNNLGDDYAEYSAALEAVAVRPVPHGYKLVPVEPTYEMLDNVDEDVGGNCYVCTKWSASHDDCRHDRCRTGGRTRMTPNALRVAHLLRLTGLTMEQVDAGVRDHMQSSLPTQTLMALKAAVEGKLHQSERLPAIRTLEDLRLITKLGDFWITTTEGNRVLSAHYKGPTA